MNRICQRCGKEYAPTGTYQKFCADCRSDAEKEYMAQYGRAHREKLTAYSLEWQKAHPGCHDGWNAVHRDKVRAAKAAYDKRHPEERRLITLRHRALKRGNTPISEVLTLEQWRQVLEKFHHRCAYCGVKSDHLTIDHVIPVSCGGADTVSNVVPACQRCNSTKNAKTPEQWVGMSVVNG